MLATLLTPIAPARAQETPLRVGTLAVDGGAEPFYAADRGLFAAHGCSVAVDARFRNGGAIIDAIVGGSLDAGFANVLSIAAAYAHGVPLAVLAPASFYRGDPTGEALFVLRDAPIRTGRDLAGKIVAVSGLRGLSHIAAQAWIDRHGGNAQSVAFVELPLAAMPAALAAGRVDAASGSLTADPAAITEHGITRVLAFPYGAIAPQFLEAAYVARSDWVANNGDLAARFGAAIVDAGRWATLHPQASQRILAQHAPLSSAALAILPSIRTPYAAGITRSDIEPVIATAIRYGVLDAPGSLVPFFAS